MAAQTTLQRFINAPPWGIVGALLTVVFGVLGIYGFVMERSPELQLTELGNVDVL